MSTTPPASPPGPPSAPPPGPPPGPPSGPPPAPPPSAAQPAGAPPSKRRGGTVWLVLFIVTAVLLVGALVLAIIGFTGKNSEADDKEKAQKELAATKKDLRDTQDQLGTQQGAGQVLGRLVNTGEKAADDLKACTDSGHNLQNQAVDVLNARQAGSDVNPLIDGLNSAIDQTGNVCGTSDTSYQQFKDAVNQIRNR
jgi:hypothetical protein